MKHLNEYQNASMELYDEKGLEGIAAKSILMHVYPETINQIIKDFEKQCKENAEFKNKNSGILKSLKDFNKKYHK